MTAADGMYFVEFEVTNRGPNCVELKSHVTMMDGTEVFFVPFTGVEQDANGIVSYIIGVSLHCNIFWKFSNYWSLLSWQYSEYYKKT